MVKNNKNFVKKNVFITKISKTLDFFSQKSFKKIVIFFSVLLYGITPYLAVRGGESYKFSPVLLSGQRRGK